MNNNQTNNYVIFDIDGTLADCSHRLHLIKTKPKNWIAFDNQQQFDTPILPVVDIATMFSERFDIVLVTGRNERSREQTEKWLDKYNIVYDSLYMRKHDDYRQDFVVKEEILDNLVDIYARLPYCVFEDRAQVIEMWVRRGIFVFDVSQGVYR